MNKTIVTFSEQVARMLMAQLRATLHETRQVLAQAKRLANQPRGRSIEYAIPKTTLEPGGECEAYLAVWNGTEFASRSDLPVMIADVHNWAFALGTDDYEDAAPLPVVLGPKPVYYTVPHPFGLLIDVKTDAGISNGSTGACSVFMGGTDTGLNVEVVNNWANDNTAIAAGVEGFAEYRSALGAWYWLGGACSAS